jgi:hypothetical protein
MARLLVTQIRADVNTPWWHETAEGIYWLEQIKPIWDKYNATSSVKVTDDGTMHVAQVFYASQEDYDNSKAECLAQHPGYLEYRTQYCSSNFITVAETFVPLGILN